MSENTAIQVAKEPGIQDLPQMVKLYFAKAVLCERRGESAEAAEYLEKAIAAEAKLNAAK